MATQRAKQSTTKQIVFSDDLVEIAEMRAGQLGVSFPDYVRFLIVEDTKPVIDNLMQFDDATSKGIIEALQDYEAGRFTTLETNEDIQKFVSAAADDSQ